MMQWINGNHTWSLQNTRHSQSWPHSIMLTLQSTFMLFTTLLWSKWGKFYAYNFTENLAKIMRSDKWLKNMEDNYSLSTFLHIPHERRPVSQPLFIRQQPVVYTIEKSWSDTCYLLVVSALGFSLHLSFLLGGLWFLEERDTCNIYLEVVP